MPVVIGIRIQWSVYAALNGVVTDTVASERECGLVISASHWVENLILTGRICLGLGHIRFAYMCSDMCSLHTYSLLERRMMQLYNTALRPLQLVLASYSVLIMRKPRN